MVDPEKATATQPEDSDLVRESRSPPDVSARSASSELERSVETQAHFCIWKSARPYKFEGSA